MSFGGHGLGAQSGAPGSGTVTNPDKIIRMQVAADADKKKP